MGRESGPQAFGSSDAFAGEPKVGGRRAGRIENRADIGNVCMILLYARKHIRLDSVCTCTVHFRRPYSMVGVHSYKHAQQPQTAAARACHPSAARLYSQHTGWESTEWVCCANCGGRAGRQAVSLFPHTLILAIGSPSRHPTVTAQSNECNPSGLRGPVTHPRWRKAQQPEKPSSTVDTVVQTTPCAVNCTQYMTTVPTLPSPDDMRLF